MFLTFTGVTYNGETVESTSIIQKEMPDGWHILLSRNGRWVRIKNETFKCMQPAKRVVASTAQNVRGGHDCFCELADYFPSKNFKCECNAVGQNGSVGFWCAKYLQTGEKCLAKCKECIL
jgi:hypothetical protein